MRILHSLRRARRTANKSFGVVLLAVLVAASLFVGSGSAATPGFVQAKATETGSGTVNNVALTNANAAGNLLVVHLIWGNTNTVTLSDTRGNTYAAATARNSWASGESEQIFYAKNIAAGTNTVKATFATTASYAIVQVHEYSGIDKVNPLDGMATGSGSGTAMSTSSLTTTAANDLLFTGGGSVGAMNAWPTGWTNRLTTSGNRTADKTATTAGSYNATDTHSGGAWTLQLAAFKADTGGAADTTPPTTPGTPAATVVSASQINLSWTVSIDNVGVTGYQVERCTGASCSNFSLVTTVSGTTYNNTGLAAATTYRYRVRATDAAGNLSPYSAITNATTQGTADSTAPSVPTGLTGSGASISQINLNWTASTDNVGVAGYKIFRNGTQVGTSATTSFQDTGLVVNTSYNYTVSAYDAANNNSAQSSPAVSVSTLPDTTAPSVPTNLATQVVSSTQINLTWTSSTDNVGVTGYKLYRCTGVGCTTMTLINTTTVNPVQDAGLTAGTTYRYAVSAIDVAGNESAQTALVTATTPAPDSNPPAVSMTAPANGSTLSGTVMFSANASDAESGVHDVEFLLDGVTIFDDTTSPYSYQWNTTTTSNGVHHLAVRAHDNAGNFSNTSGNFTVTVNNTSGTQLPAGLVAGWNFNEGTGTSSADVTGNNNTATWTAGPTWTAGKYGTGLKLNGNGDFLKIDSSPTINFPVAGGGNAMTFSTWINPTGGVEDQVLMGKFYNATMTSPYYQYGIELQNGALRPVFHIGTSGGVQLASMGSNLPAGQWSHLAVVFTGTQVQFYVNGSLVSSPSLNATISQHPQPLYLGADERPTQFFVGTLDDVRLYSRAISSTENQTDMTTHLQSPNTDPNAPTISMTTPVNGAQVNGMVTLDADADDDTGIAKVQFYVDGVAVGPEDTTAPYTALWDTRASQNGARIITARAWDIAGNSTPSDPITVNVTNTDHFTNEILKTGLSLPTAMKFLPDGRMLVSELQGKINILPAPYTSVDPTPFLQITNVNSVGVQEGIFDFALDPNFATNHYYYVYYSAHDPVRDRLSRFTANATNTGTIANSELVLYQDPVDLQSDEHHGGAINFSNDGKILLTTGEHFQGTPAQDLTSPFGKVLRFNMDGSVPTDNPFYDGAGPNYDAVWALGLRNPYRAYYDAPTDRLLVGDVGGNGGAAYERLDQITRGANYGWPNCEVGTCGGGYAPALYTYSHSGRDASITGGFVYHNNGGSSSFPTGMDGSYFFGDYAQNWIKRMTFDAQGNVTSVVPFEPADGSPDGPTGDVVYLTQGPEGALYYIDLGYSDTTGTFGLSKIRRISYSSSNQAPVAVAGSNVTSGPTPLTVNFNSAGSTDPESQPLTYSWDFGDGTSLSTAANPAHTYAAAGVYTARLTVSDGVNTTIAPPINISVGSAPVASIAGPVDGATFKAGDVISFSGDATDPDDGALPASAYKWTVDFLHEGHIHPGPIYNGVKNGTFTIPTTGHDFSGLTRYRFTLTVTDSNGLQNTKTVTIWPQKVNLTFNTAPNTGLTLYVDGIAHTAPFVYDTLIGFNHTIEARNQTLGNNNYTFANWSDGSAQTHTLVVPAADTSYTATYTSAPATSGPVAAWGFNEASGTTSADATGNNNTATLVNGLAFATGKNGNGLNFDGTNDYLTVPNSTGLDVSGNNLTLSMWVKPTGGTADQVLLGKHWNATMTSPYYQYGIELQGGGKTPVFQIGTAAGVQAVSMGTALSTTAWSHLAIVFNGSTVQFYVNGALVKTASLTATLTSRGNPLRLGADANTQQFYKGLLDDVRIYNRTQTAAEVTTDMNTAL